MIYLIKYKTNYGPIKIFLTETYFKYSKYEYES